VLLLAPVRRRNIRDGPKRAKAARELANKLGIEVKQLYMTSGETDLVLIVGYPERGQRGKIRARAWLTGQCADAHRQSLD
jgi:uncharacterized protein with GYD domain